MSCRGRDILHILIKLDKRFKFVRLLFFRRESVIVALSVSQSNGIPVYTTFRILRQKRVSLYVDTSYAGTLGPTEGKNSSFRSPEDINM
jgi:hypothetical protein